MSAPASDDETAVHTGLSWAEAARRLARDGPNELEREDATPAWRVFLRQFASALILLLLGGAVISALVGEQAEAIAIAVIVLINAIVGFNQEYRAEKAVLALRSLTAARARVVREGHAALIDAREVVVGDVLLLEPGDVVAADARLVEANELTTVEAALTGESFPVEKRVGDVPDDTPLAEQSGKVFMGTSVATGTGGAVVERTGMHTEMGKIAHLLGRASPGPTPLQIRLAALGRVLMYACVALVAVVAALGFARGLGWLEVLLTSVSLAVAAVPEGLPAVVTVALAVGVRRMSARHVLLRRLDAVETLGSATVICTDKTGTLTRGEMTVRELWGDEDAVLRSAASCSAAELGPDGKGGTGDPTEIAILRAAAERNIHRPDIERSNPRVQVQPFSAERRRMSIRRADGKLHVKGASDVVFPRCKHVPDEAVQAENRMASRGLRVLAVALGDGPDESELTLLGLIGIADAPRLEALDAIAGAHAAGIKVVMITGDHPLTAHAIAREMNIVGRDWPAEEVVFARKTAADKTEIVRGLQARGEVVAMTGDGVNDAPSIREADIGIAMGQAATEVTREASEMILTNDDLSGVVEAVKEGRIIYENIRKTVVYLLGGNAAELLFMLLAAAVGWPMPFTPIQLLWINVICEPLPGLTLAVDPADHNVLEQPPRDPKSPLLGRRQWIEIAAVAGLHVLVSAAVFAWALEHFDVDTARTLAFASFVFGVLLRGFAARSPDRLFWEVGALGNLKLLFVVILSGALQAVILLLPVTQHLFHLTRLGWEHYGLALALGFIPVSAVEISKLVRRAYRWIRSSRAGHR